MLAENETRQIELGDWTVRLRPALDEHGSQRLLVLLHGWTGDEKVMWVFTRNLPRNYWLFAPRGIFAAPGGGFGWSTSHLGVEAGIQEYLPAAARLFDLIRDWIATSDLKFGGYNLMGFSQGAAMAYTLGLIYPEAVVSIAGLAGFVPSGAEAYIRAQPFLGKRIFIAHGTRDEIVPLGKAQETADLMRMAGAQVTYCESNVGHKLGANCLRGLESFFS